MARRGRPLAAVSTALALACWAIQAASPSAGGIRTAEAAGEQLAAPRLELPFAPGSTWVVVAPAKGRRPDRSTAWAINFRPSGEVEGGSDDTVVAPIAGRVRLLDV